MKKIVVVSSHRAERGLLEGLINALDKHPKCDAHIFSLNPSKDLNYNIFQAYTHLRVTQPDIIIIPCDRQEAVAAAIAAFILQIPIRCHFNAGEMVKGGTTVDETFRPIISLMCNIWFCDSEGFVDNVKNLLKAVGRKKEIEYAYNVGKPLELQVDQSAVPNVPYDLVLYHPPTLTPEVIPKELDEIEQLSQTHDRLIYWGYPNGDYPGSDMIIDRIHKLKNKLGIRLIVFWDLPRAQFIGLVKSCDFFIGNSSSMIAEAPTFLNPEQIIHIGKRNAGRQFEGVVESDPEKIVKILEELTCK